MAANNSTARVARLVAAKEGPRVFTNDMELVAAFDTIAELAGQICAGEEGDTIAKVYAIQKLAEAASLDVRCMKFVDV